jgi:hypothetical protein
MNLVTQALIESVKWDNLRTDSGTGAGLPAAFDDLHKAHSEDAAEAAYWRIDNEVVVQGELYEAAVPALGVLLSMSLDTASIHGLRAVVELVQQIVCGQSFASEVGRVPDSNIAQQCIAAAREGIWLLYSWLQHADADIRQCALLALDVVDDNVARKQRIFDEVLRCDADPGVQKVFRDISL